MERCVARQSAEGDEGCVELFEDRPKERDHHDDGEESGNYQEAEHHQDLGEEVHDQHDHDNRDHRPDD